VDGQLIPADTVVVAMGPWSGQAADWGLPVPRVSGQKATSILLRPAADISADMLFLEYRSQSGEVLSFERHGKHSLFWHPAAAADDISAGMLFLEYRNTSGEVYDLMLISRIIYRANASFNPRTAAARGRYLGGHAGSGVLTTGLVIWVLSLFFRQICAHVQADARYSNQSRSLCRAFRAAQGTSSRQRCTSALTARPTSSCR